jgi:AcrR family transcriptional regulator
MQPHGAHSADTPQSSASISFVTMRRLGLRNVPYSAGVAASEHTGAEARPGPVAAQRRPGRPRSTALDQRILDATLTRLGRGGYDALRVDDVAADAGVAKTTLYRRWPSKEALVADAVRRLYTDRIPVVDTGDLRTDLVELLAETYGLLYRGAGAVLEDLVRRSGSSRELARVVQATTDARRRAFHTALNRAVARGDIAPSLQHELVIDLLVGPLWTRRLVTDATMTLDDVEATVDIVLNGARGRP